MVTIPTVGKYYSPFNEGEFIILKLVKEDEMFFYFSDRTKYPKDMEFSWFEREKPAEIKKDDKPFIFPYESYSLWSRQLANMYTFDELKKELSKCESNTEKYAKQHLDAIEATTSMTSQSQRRAHARSNVQGNYEKKCALRNAIELHDLYPEKCKKV